MPPIQTEPLASRSGPPPSIEEQIRRAAQDAGYKPIGLAHMVIDGRTQAMVRATAPDGRVWAFALISSDGGVDLIVGAPVEDTTSPLTVIGTIQQAQGAN